MKRFVLAVLLAACADPAPPRAPKRSEPPAAWADVFEGTPDLYAVVRPHTLKSDVIYGSLWQSLLRAAQARGIARGATMVEAVEGADEIIVGLNRGDDAEIVLRGVPASLDPQRITDVDGHALFQLRSDRGKLAEYGLADRRDVAGALFVLPDRTWVGTLGAASDRARQAFATPLGRPAPKVDADALMVLRFGGPLAHALDGHPTFGPLEKKLVSASFSLKPGKQGVLIALLYEDSDAAAWAEMQAKRITGAVGEGDKRFRWIKEAKVTYEGNTVYVRVAVPPRLLEELPGATGADLAPLTPPPP